MTVVLLSTLVAGTINETESSTTSSEPSVTHGEESTTKVSVNATTTVTGSSDKGNQTTEDPFPDCQKCIDAQAKELNETAAANAAANVANKVASELSVEDFDSIQETAKHYCIQQKKCAADRGHLVTPSLYLCIGVLFLQYILF